MEHVIGMRERQIMCVPPLHASIHAWSCIFAQRCTYGISTRRTYPVALHEHCSCFFLPSSHGEWLHYSRYCMQHKRYRKTARCYCCVSRTSRTDAENNWDVSPIDARCERPVNAFKEQILH